jgi:hypothetical protein
MASGSSGFQNIVAILQATVESINAITQTISGALTQIWAAFVPVALADAATVSIDLSTGINFTLLATSAVGATRMLGNPANAKIGQRGYILFTQDGAGGNALTYGSQYQAAGGVAALAPATGANAVNLFLYVVLPGPLVALSLLSNLEH